MSESYELVLHDCSAQPDLAFILYAVPTVDSGVQALGPRGGYPVVWQEQGVNIGATVYFQWTASYALMCARQPCQVGEPWQPGATEQVRGPGSAYLLDYSNDDFRFSAAIPSGDLPPTAIDLYTSGNVPTFDGTQGPSVGLAISTGGQPTTLPVIATDSGPNMAHRFTLPPVYRIWAGQDKPGTMLDLGTVRGHQEVRFTRGSTSDPWRAEWTLDPTNQWRSGAPA
jgi:hypothetical protein